MMQMCPAGRGQDTVTSLRPDSNWLLFDKSHVPNSSAVSQSGRGFGSSLLMQTVFNQMYLHERLTPELGTNTQQSCVMGKVF